MSSIVPTEMSEGKNSRYRQNPGRTPSAYKTLVKNSGGSDWYLMTDSVQAEHTPGQGTQGRRQ